MPESVREAIMASRVEEAIDVALEPAETKVFAAA